MMPVIRAAFALLIGGLACAGGSDDARVEIAPRPSRQSGRPGALRVDVKLILVPVTVTDAFGAPRSGLPRQAFRVFEDGVEQQVKYFATQDAPVSLSVVFDSSRSMEGKLGQSRAAVARFFAASAPGDEFSVVEFNDTPRVLSGFTGDTAYLEKSLAGIQPRNWTALFDAVYLATGQMKRAKNPRQALLILSDGADNRSRYSEREMKALVREAGVCIYSIALVGGGPLKSHAGLLRELSAETGGLLREVAKIKDLPAAVEQINAAIRNQYLLGFSSRNPKNNGLYRKIEVRLNPGPGLEGLRATWRRGYYEPDEP